MWTYKAEVLRVVDGDTIDVLVDLGFGVYKKERLRLARVDAWETRLEEREKGLAAKEFVKKETPEGSTVTITTSRKGKYGRYIAEVSYLGSDRAENLSDKLVQEGHAIPYGTRG